MLYEDWRYEIGRRPWTQISSCVRPSLNAAQVLRVSSRLIIIMNTTRTVDVCLWLECRECNQCSLDISKGA